MEIGRLWKELEREALSTPTLCDLPIITFFTCQKQFLYTDGNRLLVEGTGEGSPLHPLSL